MTRFFIWTIALVLTTLASCSNNSKNDDDSVKSDIEPADTSSQTVYQNNKANFSKTDNTSDSLCCDSTFRIFNDDSYFVSFQILKSKNQDSESHLGKLTLNHKVNGATAILLSDTLEFAFPIIQLEDMNNDKIKDILINNTSSARSVWTKHLYLVDNKSRRLKRIKGFEEVCDPILDSENNIIIGMARYSCLYYSFYRITKDDKLVNLGNDYEDCNNDSAGKYNKTIKKIVRQNK